MYFIQEENCNNKQRCTLFKKKIVFRQNKVMPTNLAIERQ